ncbi:MAG: hypothetical protein ABI604_09025 [Nitrospirota bacterium]
MLAVADQAQYIYDNLGRLSQVIDGKTKGVGKIQGSGCVGAKPEGSRE